MTDAGGDITLCMTSRNFSARAYHRTQSVELARTLAHLAGREEIQPVHLAEALHASQSSEVGVELNIDSPDPRVGKASGHFAVGMPGRLSHRGPDALLDASDRVYLSAVCHLSHLSQN